MNNDNAQISNWPVVTGCHRVSEGCNSCPSYWEYEAEGKSYEPVEHPTVLDTPLLNSEPTHYEVAFGSDLFHADVTLNFQKLVFEVMNKADWHTFSVGTKRIGRALIYSSSLKWSDNIVCTVPIESGKYEWRIDLLRRMPAKTKVISIVPILGPFSSDLDLSGIDAVGVTEETWGYKRPADPAWKKDIQRQCLEQEVSFGDTALTYVKEGQEQYAI
jgi:protein gp37